MRNSSNKNFGAISKLEQSKVLKVLSFYGVPGSADGKLIIRKSRVAFINNIYMVQSIGVSKYILRESHPGASLEHIKLEIEVLDFLQKKGFKLSPVVIRSKLGKSVVRANGRYYILQNFISGTTVANWDNLLDFSLLKLKEFFSVSAHFSKSVKNFKTGLKLKNAGLANYVNNAADWLEARLCSPKTVPGLALLRKDAAKIRNFMNCVREEFKKSSYDNLPKQLVHYDLHPGNVNYIGNKISGIFDFDWVRFDSRITDLAGTIAQSCYFYGGRFDGKYRPERIRAGLKVYCCSYGQSEFSKKEENKLILLGLKGCIIFQLMFTYDWYLKNVNNPRHLQAVKHFIRLITKNNFNGLIS